MTGTEAQGERAKDAHTCLSEEEFKKALIAITPHLRAFGRTLCGCPDRADDLAQETLLKAWGARLRYEAGTNLKAWAFTILRNQFFSEVRRNRFHGEYDEGLAEHILQTPASQESALELTDVIRAMEVLPAIYREALILVGVGNMSYEDVAQICGIAVGTVKSRLSRARAMLTNTIASGQMPDFRHNFVLKGESIDAFFDELGRISNRNADEAAAA